MSSRQWSLPARVYARPLELHSGKVLSEEELRLELEWLGYRASPSPDPGHYAINGNTLVLSSRGFHIGTDSEAPTLVNVTWQGDAIESVADHNTKEPRLVRLEPLEIGAIHPQRHEDRVLVTLDDLPAGFVDTLIAVEDRKFYRHFGVSLKGVLRAVWTNLRSGSKRQGASTLTQQLVKNLFLTNRKTWSRKFNEALMALLLEWRYSKEIILETFANEVFITQDGSRAIHGFGLASQYFFDRPLNELEIHQYALLIGMLKAPTTYNPIRHPDEALARRNLVITLMQDQKVVNAETAAAAKQRDLEVSAGGNDANGNPTYLDAVKRQLLEEYALEDLQKSGLAVFTHYDPLIQYALERNVESGLARIESQFEKHLPSTDFLEVAGVITSTGTGEIKAMIGGRQSRYAGFNRAIDAARPVGSLLKPAIYLSAWQQPARYTLLSKVTDSPVAIEQPDGSVWSPSNFDEQVHGDVTLLDALKRSLNLASVNLGMDIGLPAIMETLENLGTDKSLRPLPSLLLGAEEFSVLQMANLYQTIATDGYTVPLRTIQEVQSAEGETLKQYSIDIQRKLDPRFVYLLKYALTEAMLTGTGSAAYDILPSGFFAAGKTGTSDQQRDSWFAGFTGDYSAVIWVGNDENRETPLTGSSGALPIWAQLMKEISHEPIDYTPPDGIVFATVDIASGKRISKSVECSFGIELPFVQGTIPEEEIPCPGQGSRLGRWLRSLLR